jgi:hypothetical protein
VLVRASSLQPFVAVTATTVFPASGMEVIGQNSITSDARPWYVTLATIPGP